MHADAAHTLQLHMNWNCGGKGHENAAFMQPFLFLLKDCLACYITNNGTML